ncbi:MAG: hypothetical protein WBB19_02515 [Desulforhopalus sp.]
MYRIPGRQSPSSTQFSIQVGKFNIMEFGGKRKEEGLLPVELSLARLGLTVFRKEKVVPCLLVFFPEMVSLRRVDACSCYRQVAEYRNECY